MRYACTKTLHHADNFVPRNDRKTNKRELTIPYHQVTMADTTRADSDQHFSMPWRGDGALLDFEIAFGFS
jgi:hypothetical protein